MNEEKHWKMPDWIRMNMISKEGAFTMAKVFITLTGTKHYYGNDFLEKGTKIRLEKEPDNEYDKEAIKVTYEGLGKIGYVANSCLSVRYAPAYRPLWLYGSSYPVPAPF